MERERKLMERKLDWLVALVERASGRKFAPEAESGVVEVAQPLARSSRTAAG
jgi:hypothetical protein